METALKPRGEEYRGEGHARVRVNRRDQKHRRRRRQPYFTLFAGLRRPKGEKETGHGERNVSGGGGAEERGGEVSRPRGEVAAGREPPEIPEWAAMIVSLGNPSRDTGSRRKDECADAGSALPDAAGGSTLAKEKKKKLSAVRNSRRNSRGFFTPHGEAGEGSVSFSPPLPFPSFSFERPRRGYDYLLGA